MHKGSEDILLKKGDGGETFTQQFQLEMAKVKEETDPNLLERLNLAAPLILDEVLPEFERFYGPDYEVLAVEEPLFEPIEGLDGWFFKGFVDYALLEKDTGVYHLGDFKTTASGWHGRNGKTKEKLYQLSLYKHFWGLKHKIDPKNIKTEFVFEKYSVKNNRVEFFQPTNGGIRVENALKEMKNVIWWINAGKCWSNFSGCKQYGEYCPFYKTEHCR